MISATQVCSRWRRIALETPTLWIHFDFSDDMSQKMFDALIERSANAYLDVQFRIRTEPPEEDTIPKPELWESSGFPANATPPVGIMKLWTRMKSVSGVVTDTLPPLPHRLPALHSLEVYSTHGTPLIQSLGAYPNLLHLAIEGASQSTFSNIYRTLRTLHIRRSEFSIPDLCTQISFSSKLEELVLEQISIPIYGTNARKGDQFKFNSLKLMVLKDNAPSFNIPFLEAVSLSSRTFLAIEPYTLFTDSSGKPYASGCITRPDGALSIHFDTNTELIAYDHGWCSTTAQMKPGMHGVKIPMLLPLEHTKELLWTGSSPPTSFNWLNFSSLVRLSFPYVYQDGGFAHNWGISLILSEELYLCCPHLAFLGIQLNDINPDVADLCFDGVFSFLSGRLDVFGEKFGMLRMGGAIGWENRVPVLEAFVARIEFGPIDLRPNFELPSKPRVFRPKITA